MAEADPRSAVRWLAFSAALAATAGGCASEGTRPEPLPSQAVTAHRPEPAPPAAATPAPAAPAPKPETMVIIDPPQAVEERAPTLGEAAQRERERRLAGSRPPVAVINNQNLAQFVKDQKLTVANPEPGSTGEASDAEATAAAELAEREDYWRQRGLEIRQRWREALDTIAKLEGDSAELRRRFYSTDDPYVRDGQIKPEWDRILAELDRARREAAAAPRDLADFFDEARHAGALPGWLEEGVELEPEAAPEARTRKMPEADIGEPPMVEEDPGDP
jgi:hypothetical protein